jgi:hypothetical protein
LLTSADGIGCAFMLFVANLDTSNNCSRLDSQIDLRHLGTCSRDPGE